MEDEQRDEGNGPQKYTGFSASTASPAAVESSSLSDAKSMELTVSTPDPNATSPDVHEHDQEQTDDGAAVTGSVQSSAEEDSSDDDNDVSFKCQHCGKAYPTNKSLKRHMNDKRTICARSRPETQDETSKWACPRCHVGMPKKYSVERHIKDSCWKVCDECSEAGNARCDAVYKDGDCTNCASHGRSCTKHTGPVPDCVAELLTGRPAQPPKPGSRAKRTAVTTSRKREKRKADTSPEASPESKHVPKRVAAIIKKEKTARPHPRGIPAQQDPSGTLQRVQQEAVQGWLRDRQNLPDADPDAMRQYPLRKRFPLEPPFGVPKFQDSRPSQPARGRHDGVGPALPLPSGYDHTQRPLQGQRDLDPAPGLYSRRPTQVQGYPGLAPNLMPGMYPSMLNHNGSGLAPFNPTISAYNSNMNNQMIQQALLSQQQQMYNMAMINRNRTGYLPPPPTRKYATDVNTRRTDFEAAHPPEARLNRFRPVQNGEFQIHEDIPKNGHRETFLASAPGSRMPSRRSSAEQLQVPESGALPHPRSSQQLRGLNRVSDVQSGKRQLPGTTKSVPRKLMQSIALQRSASPAPDPRDPLLKLQIHSNTYDALGNAIFSILSIRDSQKFGPRLDAYCQHRNKQYGVDWVFIYRYRAPTEEDKKREKYINITYNMTPKDVKDEEYPGMAIADSDTIFVMKARSPLAEMVERDRNEGYTPVSSPVGSQVSSKEVNIVNGETPVYQDPETVTGWLKHCQSKVTDLRNRTGELSSTISHQKKKMAQQARTIADLQNGITELRNDNMQMRLERLQSIARSHIDQASRLAGAHRAPPMQVPSNPSFMSRLEALREPIEPTHPQQFNPLHFPTFSDGNHDLPRGYGQYPPPSIQSLQYAGYGPDQGMRSQAMRPQGMPPQNMHRKGPVHDAASKVAAAKGQDEEENEGDKEE